MEKRKKTELSLASVWFMLLVIFIHCAAEGVEQYLRPSLPFVVICSLHRLSSFVVQGFLFLSGVKLFLRGTGSLSTGRFYLGRLRRVVLPYVLVFSLFYGYFLFTGAVSPSAGGFFRELFTGGLVGHFYFVAIICPFYLLLPLWKWLYEKGSPLLTLLVSLFLTILCQNYLPDLIRSVTGESFAYNGRLFTTYLIYFTGGIFAAKYYDIFVAFLKHRRKSLLVLTTLVGAVDCVIICLIYCGVWYPAWGDIGHMLYCILAIFSTLSLGLAISEKKSPIPPRLTALFERTDRVSYQVYLLHPLIIFLLNSLFYRVGIASLTTRFLLRLPITVLLTVGICLAAEWGMAQIRSRKKI